MPRLTGARERIDKMLYDTTVVDPGTERRLFGNANVGDWRKTNLQVAGQMPGDSTYTILAVGVRCVGRTRDEEDLLLDQIRLTVNVGSHPALEIFGPYASMLRHVFTSEEVHRMRLQLDDLNRWCDDAETAEHDFEEGRCRRCARSLDSLPTFPAFRVGYHCIRPVVVPTRQNFNVLVQATEWLTGPVALRVHLFGLLTRDMS